MELKDMLIYQLLKHWTTVGVASCLACKYPNLLLKADRSSSFSRETGVTCSYCINMDDSTQSRHVMGCRVFDGTLCVHGVLLLIRIKRRSVRSRYHFSLWRLEPEREREGGPIIAQRCSVWVCLPLKGEGLGLLWWLIFIEQTGHRWGWSRRSI